MARFVQLFTLACLGVIFLSACTPQLRALEAPVRLYVMDCGKIEIADASLVSPGAGQGEKAIFANACYLIVHTKGVLLWDTGLADLLAKAPGAVSKGGFTFSIRKTLISQLRQIGYTPYDIGLVGFSHFHPDHTGNANLFRRSIILVQKEEYSAAFGAESARYQFDRSTYDALSGSKFIKLQGDHDVFGDGLVVIKRAVGHTPGHQMLYVNLSKTGGVLLSGDLAHSWDNWSHDRVPLFNYDKVRSLQAMKEVREFLKKSGAQLWIQHDLEQSLTLKHSPSYYE